MTGSVAVTGSAGSAVNVLTEPQAGSAPFIRLIDGARRSIELTCTRDYAVLDSQPTDVAAIVGAFDADYAGRRVTVSAGTGDLVWSPGAATTVISFIGAATHSIDLENEEMAYAPARTALCAAARNGVAVRVVMTYASEWRGDFTQLRRCGVMVHLYHGQRYYIHAKLLIVDDGRALVGSQNLSTGSLQHNRELGITLRARPLVSQFAADFSADYRGARASTASPWLGIRRTRSIGWPAGQSASARSISSASAGSLYGPGSRSLAITWRWLRSSLSWLSLRLQTKRSTGIRSPTVPLATRVPTPGPGRAARRPSRSKRSTSRVSVARFSSAPSTSGTPWQWATLKFQVGGWR